MRIDLYYQSNVSGTKPDSSGINSMSFGNVVAGSHCDYAFCLKPVVTTETEITSAKFFLEDLDTLDAEVGFYQQAYNAYIQQKPNNNNLSAIHLTEVHNPTIESSGGQTLTIVDDTKLPYIWLDVEIASTQSPMNPTTYKKEFNGNFVLLFEYN